jgi:ATP-dependent DNA helicase RecG
LPENILEKFDLVPLNAALRGIHFPKDDIELKQSTDRLKFDELLLPQLKSELARQYRETEAAPPLVFREVEIKKFVESLPFILTKTQKISAWEILKDLSRPQVMNRMLAGDVGSGKTIIAAMALFNTVLNGFQGVLMAPTEILARQHFNTLNKLLGDKLNIALLSRSQFEATAGPEQGKKEIIKMIGDGRAQIVVGTHALLTDKVQMNNVGLVIVDEQHRFGVAQRKMIKDKTADISAHYLSMTATPIPRSLALMIYGDLDLSIINELPPGRKPIITRLVEPRLREKAYDFIRKQVKEGRQVFVICPLIEESATEEFIPVNYNFDRAERGEKKTVMAEYEKLSKNIFPEFVIGNLHGKLKPADKETVMNKFKNNEIQILVSTSVVEVGVDIPNASVMMIEGADRFGLAQLHQFRGRVGRSVHQSYCFLFTDSSSVKVGERLSYFEKNLDGFMLAEKDLETRGPGEVYGTLQSGLTNFRLAKLTDKELIKKTREAAVVLAENLPKFPKIAKAVADWEKSTHLE